MRKPRRFVLLRGAADAGAARHGADGFSRRRRVRRHRVEDAGTVGEAGAAWAAMTVTVTTLMM